MEIVGVDTGGTFTDFIYKSGEKWGVFKHLSTPENPAEAVLGGLKKVLKNENFQVVHGSTVATNAILERKGANTALITNKKFEDVFEIGRQNRSELYNLKYRRENMLVPATLRFGLNCRINVDGEEIEPFDEQEARSIIAKLKQAEVESVAVCFLFSYLNPTHEIQMGELLREAEIPFSLSHKVLSEFREYERTSTTVVNAYVSPKMKRYITYIMQNFGGNELRVMQSNGGSISADTAMEESVRTILSGPAGGAVGAYEIAKKAGFDKIITFDMGGTSTDVALLDEGLPLTMESTISNFPVKVPMIDIHTVGAGGGSIAYIDKGGSLKVGPESAGADPGPICYGKGKDITVTDANLFLGRLVPENFLGGNMKLNTDKLKKSFGEMSKKINLSSNEVAEGILAVANTAMERAIRVISVERGHNPQEFALFSFGGAGGMHAVSLARLLKMPKVIIPMNPGILSAIGMLMADLIKDYSLTVMLKNENISRDEIDSRFVPIQGKAYDEMRLEGIDKEDVIIEKYLDMRYQGQSYEILVPYKDDFEDEFHKLHEQNYGYCNKNKPVEVVNIRLRARGMPEKPVFEKIQKGTKKPESKAYLGSQDVVFDGETYRTGLYDRKELKSGNVIEGAAILLEYSSTIVLPPHSKAEVDDYGNLVIDTEGGI